MTASGHTPAVWRNRALGLLLAVVIAGLDRLIKWWVLGPLAIRERPGQVIDLLPIFDLRFTRNFGVSLGMFEATSVEMRWILVLVTGIIATIVLVWMLRERLLGDILGLGLILGGAIGNIYDRYFYGYVVDYADLHFGDFRPFLIFNLADAAITIGVVLILARSLLLRDKTPETKPADDSAVEKTHA